MEAKKGDATNLRKEKTDIKISIDTSLKCGKKEVWNDEGNLSLPEEYTKSKGYNNGEFNKAYKALLRK